ncbi:MAG: radical SAM protein [Candidatus Diapherotrites archaeon]|nr:radical SAM protein [Candidatus Diapherotrites archaeon]
MEKQKLSFRHEYFGGLLYDPDIWTLKAFSKSGVQEFFGMTKEIPLIFNNPKTGFLSAPLKVFVAISASCNLRCKHCMVGKKRTQTKELSFSSLKKVFKQLGQMGVFEVRLGGFEPTARKDFDKIFEEAKKNNLTVSINTNGVCADEIREKLANSCVDKVHVSLDGLEKNHDYIRGIGSFKRAIETIKLLKSKRKYVRIVVCLYKDNLCDVDELIKIAEQLDCDIKFSPVSKIGSAEEMQGLLDRQENELLKTKMDLFKKKVNVFFNYGTMAPDFFDYCDISDFDSVICGAGRTQLRIENNGDVIMAGCGDLLSGVKPLGNVKESFSAMWEKSQFVMEELMKERGQKCSSCSLESVFGAWLKKPTPAFNFWRE